MPRPTSYAVFCLKEKTNASSLPRWFSALTKTPSAETCVMPDPKPYLRQGAILPLSDAGLIPRKGGNRSSPVHMPTNTPKTPAVYLHDALPILAHNLRNLLNRSSDLGA